MYLQIRMPVSVLCLYVRTVLRGYLCTVLRPYVCIILRSYIKYIRTPLHSPSKSEIKGLSTCSEFLLNDFSCKQLTEGVTDGATIIALNISLRTSRPHSMLIFCSHTNVRTGTAIFSVAVLTCVLRPKQYLRPYCISPIYTRTF